jgi:hypothetical protein
MFHQSGTCGSHGFGTKVRLIQKCETQGSERDLTGLMAESQEGTPSPEEVQRQMRSAVERIREKWSEPEPKSGDPPPENQPD